MKKQLYFSVYFLVIICLLFFSCKKNFENLNGGNFEKLQLIDKQKFFQHSEDLEPQIVRIIEDIKRQDSIFNFTQKLIERHGYPVWNLTAGNYHVTASQLALENASNSAISTDTLLFFIPFKRADVKNINTIIACTQIGNKFSYKLLKRQYYEYRVLTSPTFNSFDRSSLAVFSFFEQRVNHIDSIELGYFKNVKIKNARIKMTMTNGNVINLNTAEIMPDSYVGFNVSFCIEEKCDNCVAYAKPTNADVVIVAAPPPCWSETYWAFTGDGGGGSSSGTGTGTGYTGGTGTGGSGSGGGSNGTGGYICPVSEWWCESGDYRVINNELLTQDYYPFKENGFPWLWWENPNLKDAHGYLYKNLSILAIESFKNPNVLLKCDELNVMPLDPVAGYGKQFQRLSQFTSPSEVIDRLVELNAQNPRSKFNIQSVDKANGASVNCDYFPVRIARLPNGYTMKTLLEKFRKSTNSFIDPSLNVTFTPYVGAGINDTQLFNEDGINSLSSLVHIKLIDNGTVVLSDYVEKVNGNSFIYSTLTSPFDNAHPVSGNREFGIFQNPNSLGEYTFYTTAVDRTTDILASILNEFTNVGFSSADNLWRNVQKNMVNFINNNGGQAALLSPSEITARPDWDKVKKFLRGEISYNQLRIELGC